MSMTTREQNLACLYYSGSRADTAVQIREALPSMDKPDTATACSALAKLDAMSDMEFALTFRESVL